MKIKFHFSALLAIHLTNLMSIFMAIATTVITEGTVDVGFPAVLCTEFMGTGL